MLIIPAIDLKDGQCVRLLQGRLDDSTVFSNDPIATAQRWVDAGARRLHIVDLDGAFKGKPTNDAMIRNIASAFPALPIQVGGGIRDISIINAYFDAGVQFVVVGTKAITNPTFLLEAAEKFPNQVILGLDANNGQVATEGWTELSKKSAIEVAQEFSSAPLAGIVYTDISKDGMLQGPNITSTLELAQTTSIPIIASGGISHLNDIKALCEIESSGVVGAITGRAIYEGTLDLSEAQLWCDSMYKENNTD